MDDDDIGYDVAGAAAPMMMRTRLGTLFTIARAVVRFRRPLDAILEFAAA